MGAGMAEPDDLFVARYVLERRLQTRAQLRDALFEQARERLANPAAPARPLGVILITRGVLDEDKLRRVLQKRVTMPGDPQSAAPELEVGRLLVMAGSATTAQVTHWIGQATEAQRSGRPQTRLIAHLLERGWTTSRLVARGLLYHRKAAYVCIGCKKRYNILNPKPDTEYTCTKCGTELVPAAPETAAGETQTFAVHAQKPAEDVEIDRLLAADRVFQVMMERKGLMDREAMRSALRAQTDLMRFDEAVPLWTVAGALGLLGAEAQREVERTKFADVAQSSDWSRQALPGAVVSGRVTLDGDASLLEATPQYEERRFLVKLMHRDRAADPAAVERFQREASFFAEVGHPRFVHATETGALVTRKEHVEVPYAMLDAAAGEALDQVLALRGPVPSAIALRLAADLAEALAFLKSKGLSHGGIAPERVLVDARSRARLWDLEEMPEYSDAGLSVDLDGLGRTLFAMLTGKAAPAYGATLSGVEGTGASLTIASKLLGADGARRYASLEEAQQALAPHAATG